MGDEVRVITNHPHYPAGIVPPGFHPITIRREVIDGIPVLRLPVLARPNTGIVDRIIDQGSFAFAAAAATEEVRWADVLLVESPPLFLGLTARWLSHVTRRPYVFHVADPWPDYPIEVGALRGSMAIRLARWLERVSYAGAHAITTPTRGCAAIIAPRAPLGSVRVIPNAVDTERFRLPMTRGEARTQLGWDPAVFTFVYVGNIGLAQGLGTLLKAANRLASTLDQQRVAIRIVGDGPERTQLEAEALSTGLGIVKFDGSRAIDEIPTILTAADVALILLRRGKLAEAALPTKLVEAMAAGQPIVISADGDARSLVDDALAGWSAPAEDADALAAAMKQAMLDGGESLRGARGRAVAVNRFDRKQAVELIREVLISALTPVGQSGPSTKY
jgi:glycosyltransferase involved in cell wall biosynthesis